MNINASCIKAMFMTVFIQMSATKRFSYQIEMVTNTAKEDLDCKKRKARCQKHATHVLYTLIIYWLGTKD